MKGCISKTKTHWESNSKCNNKSVKFTRVMAKELGNNWVIFRVQNQGKERKSSSYENPVHSNFWSISNHAPFFSIGNFTNILQN